MYKTRKEEDIFDAIRLPDHELVCQPDEKGKRAYAQSFALQHANTDPFQAKRLYETYGGKTFVVQNPPAKPLSMREMDDVYALPYMRTWHPMYDEAGGIPALGEIRFSLTSNRGCYGDCNFCALTFHEGRIVQVRSHESILQEAREKQALILKEASETRNAIVEKAKENARAEGARLLSEAKAEIESEKQNAIRDIRAQVAELSVQIAGKVLHKELQSDKKQMELIEKLLDEISVDGDNK